MKPNKRIACIDADSIIYKNSADKVKKDTLGNTVLDDWGRSIKEERALEECKQSLDEYIKNILDTTEATHYILALTVGKCHRYEIYPEYKANRKDKPKPKHFDTLKDYCVIKYKAIFHNELEADDICLIYSKTLTNDENYAFVCSLDKDLLSLEGTHFNYDKNEWVTISKDESHKFFWKDMIAGQHGDNVKAIPGKGEKFATMALEEAFNIGYSNPVMVLNCYIEKFGEDLGIKEFYKNYQVLKIKDSWPNFKLEEPLKYVKPEPFNANLIDF